MAKKSKIGFRERIIESKKLGFVIVLLDNDDYDRLRGVKISVWMRKGKIYAKLIDGTILSRYIKCAPNNKDVDHVNGNTLDNRKENLRICTRSQNNMNKGLQSNNTTGYKGVTFKKHLNRYRVQIQVNNRKIHGGYFEVAEDAAKRYDELAIKYHGKYAYRNLINGDNTRNQRSKQNNIPSRSDIR